jgi:uncharacterized iron-regulated membrane protein
MGFAPRYNDPTSKKTAFYAAITAVSILVIAAVLLGGVFAVKAVSRYQKVQDTKNFVKTSQMEANNQTTLNEIQISQTKQLIQVENQKAEIRVAEAKGIAESQKIINASLTPLYLQHEAINAQIQMANSPNHTQVYIPVGDNGIPLVRTTGP